MKKAIHLIIIVLILSLFLASCRGKPADEMQGTGSPKTGALDVKIIFAALARGKASCSSCDTISFTVSASDMLTMNFGPYPYSLGYAELAGIPTGNGRELDVVIKDAGNAILYSGSKPGITVDTSITPITITVYPNAPTWQTAPSNITITGGSTYNQTDGTAQDLDAGQTLTCSNNGTSCGFSVTVSGSGGNPQDCNVSFTAPQSVQACGLRVMAADNSTPSLTVGQTIFIIVNTLSHHYPTWQTPPSNIIITAGSVSNQINGIAMDADAGQTLTCSNNGASCGFGVTVSGAGGNPQNCNVSFTASVSQQTCNLRITATDNDSPSLSVGQTISITVTNKAPTWSTTPSNITIHGGSVYNKTDGVATDIDAGQTITCSNNGTSCGFATTETGSGLPANCNLSFTAPASAQTCNLRIMASDNGSPSLTVGQTITINVIVGSANHSPTWSTTPSNITITSGSVYNQTDGVATDVDGGQTIACSSNGTSCGFSITVTGSGLPANCNLSFTAPASAQTCNLRIMAADNGSPSLSVGQTISITINTATNHFPTWQTAPTNIAITGGSVYNQTDGVATDVDSGQTLTCLNNGTSCGFTITVTGSGLPANCNVSFTAPVPAGTCNLRIAATDNGSPSLSVGQTISITIRNNAPTWSTTPSNITITGGSVYNQTNGAATDVDTGQTIACSNNGASCGFSITVTGSGAPPRNCNVSFTAPVPAQTCNLRITATDNGAPAMSVGATISITVKNHAPTWSTTPSNITITGGSTYNKTDGVATDVDTGQTITCSNNGTSCAFAVTVSGSGASPQSCNVSFKALSPTQTCNLRIKAADNGSPSLTIGKTVSITISGNHTQLWQTAPSNITITMGSVYNQTDGVATDIDTGQTITCSSNGTSCGFTVTVSGSGASPQACNISFTAPSSLQTCNLRVTAADNGTPSLSVGQTITITVNVSSGMQAISAGYYHTCALTTAGGVKCWGYNYYGQLGDNTTNTIPTPVDVVGLSSGVETISAGGFHTCALTTAGGVKCWGENGYGQLGDNSTTDKWTPVDVAGLTSGVAAIAGGDYHTCALTTAGGVKCWGGNWNGELGDNSTTNRSTPVDVSGLTSGVAAISAGEYHTCALTTTGGVKCWGYNYYGQLGDNNSPNDSWTPVDVVGLSSGVTAISVGGYHTCALTTAGGLKCWGWNGNGQIGDNTTNDRYTPVDVVGLTSGVAAVSAGDEHSCALTTSSGVKCWGYNSNGQIGDNTTTDRWTPVDVAGLTSGGAAISAGGLHTCALTAAGGVKCWGYNNDGQLGNNNLPNDSWSPADVVGLSSVPAAVSAGGHHTCALTTAGGVKCWGFNGNGQLGDNTYTTRSTPVYVFGLTSGVAEISAGGDHTCAITTAGGAKCWGANYGSTPVDVSGLTSGVATISAGGTSTGWSGLVGHTCALTTTGGFKCWGYNNYGQLGDNATTDSWTPVDVCSDATCASSLSGVAAISAGYAHTCAVTTAGRAKCWGYNSYGQVGDNTTNQRNAPVNVVGLTSGVAAISAGYYHTCALTTAGGVKCWGYNIYGQLGDSTTTDRWVPVDVVGLTSGVAAISAGFNYTCALTTTGGVKCWGWNYGLTPGDVGGLSSGVAEISAGGSNNYSCGGTAHTCVLTTADEIKCWGNNCHGQLGNNSGSDSWTPVDIVGW